MVMFTRKRRRSSQLPVGEQQKVETIEEQNGGTVGSEVEEETNGHVNQLESTLEEEKPSKRQKREKSAGRQQTNANTAHASATNDRHNGGSNVVNEGLLLPAVVEVPRQIPEVVVVPQQQQQNEEDGCEEEEEEDVPPVQPFVFNSEALKLLEKHDFTQKQRTLVLVDAISGVGRDLAAQIPTAVLDEVAVGLLNELKFHHLDKLFGQMRSGFWSDPVLPSNTLRAVHLLCEKLRSNGIVRRGSADFGNGGFPNSRGFGFASMSGFETLENGFDSPGFGEKWFTNPGFGLLHCSDEFFFNTEMCTELSEIPLNEDAKELMTVLRALRKGIVGAEKGHFKGLKSNLKVYVVELVRRLSLLQLHGLGDMKLGTGALLELVGFQRPPADCDFGFNCGVETTMAIMELAKLIEVVAGPGWVFLSGKGLYAYGPSKGVVSCGGDVTFGAFHIH